MIIPIRCFTCGKVLADKWNYYVKEVEKMQKKPNSESSSSPNLSTKTDDNLRYFDNNMTNEILTRIGIDKTKICCRRHILGHVDIIDQI